MSRRRKKKPVALDGVEAAILGAQLPESDERDLQKLCQSSFSKITVFTPEPVIPPPKMGYTLAYALNRSPLRLAGRKVNDQVAVLVSSVNARRSIWTVHADTFDPWLVANLDPKEMYGDHVDWFPILSDAKGIWRFGDPVELG